MSGDAEERGRAPEGGNAQERVRAGIEAVLFLADEPVPAAALAEVLEVTEDEVTAHVEALAQGYADTGRGIEIRRAGGGWRMYTAPLAAAVIERWAVAGRTGRLTQAALETLAVIAYKQPVSRQDVGDIRGVNADAAIRSLVARGLVADVGRDPGPGQAVLYGTTTTFLERLGIDAVSDLPPLTDFLPEAPAPDEPELGALREVRRRLAAGDDLPSRSDGGAAQRRDDGADGADRDEGDDLLPPPLARPREDDADARMEELTDELDRVARSAVDRLRRAVATGGLDDEDTATTSPSPSEQKPTDEPGIGADDG